MSQGVVVNTCLPKTAWPPTYAQPQGVDVNNNFQPTAQVQDAAPQYQEPAAQYQQPAQEVHYDQPAQDLQSVTIHTDQCQVLGQDTQDHLHSVRLMEDQWVE